MVQVMRDKLLFRLYSRYKYTGTLLKRRAILSKFIKGNFTKVYYGCGNVRQVTYINIDVRWTPSVDIIGDLQWCSRNLQGCCEEVYLSHVLEHYSFPGKVLRQDSSTVLGALLDVHRMLQPGGIIRLAVPDFAVISKLYLDGVFPLFPRLLGRLCGEQNYSENLHKCMFDTPYLTDCLERAGFNSIERWDPQTLNFAVDASFDRLNGISTSLNLLGKKI